MKGCVRPRVSVEGSPHRGLIFYPLGKKWNLLLIETHRGSISSVRNYIFISCKVRIIHLRVLVDAVFISYCKVRIIKLCVLFVGVVISNGSLSSNGRLLVVLTCLAGNLGWCCSGTRVPTFSLGWRKKDMYLNHSRKLKTFHVVLI